MPNACCASDVKKPVLCIGSVKICYDQISGRSKAECLVPVCLTLELALFRLTVTGPDQTVSLRQDSNPGAGAQDSATLTATRSAWLHGRFAADLPTRHSEQSSPLKCRGLQGRQQDC
ncbi:hypothetical protein RRG08_037791 [Elysia crispata]|uniref:Uncharacterized protein n=1 Tax=Elysia crispata TaxID=231223 RepID=A0AAE1BC83_9GAST|nr:hypothetical protein RRG08_037791 [Elysia crispata]